MFFTSGQKPQLSQQALSAYAQAVSISLMDHLNHIYGDWLKSSSYLLIFICPYLQEKIDKASSMNPDLHFNRATVTILLVAFTHAFSNRWAPANVSQWDYYIFMILTSSPAFCSSLAFSFNLLADRSLLIVWLPDKTLILDTSQANETNMSFLSPVVPVWGDVQFSSGWIQSSCSPGPWLGRRSGEGKTAAEIPRPDYNVIREQGERNWQRHCNIYGAFTLTQIGCFQFIPMGAELLWDWRRIRESIALCNSCQVQVVMCVMSVSKSVYCTGVSVEFSV